MALDRVAIFQQCCRLDIVVANWGSDNVSVLLGYGNGSFQDQITYSTGSGPFSVAVGDFNDDTRLDIVVANSDSDDVSVFLGCDNEVFVKKSMLITSRDSKPRSFVSSDFNNDGYIDLVVANLGTDNIAIFLGHGNISFASPSIYTTGSNSSPYSVAAADFNNDTYVDIVVANYGSGSVGIFLGYGNGSFANYTTYQTDSHPYTVAVGDFDNDFISDLIVVYYDSNNIRLLYGYRNGTFAKMILIQLEYGSGPFSVVVGDFNNDQKARFCCSKQWH